MYVLKKKTFVIILIVSYAVPKILLKNALCNGNRTEWSPVRSVVIREITKSDDRAAGVRFVYHEYDYTRDYRQNWRRHKVLLPINHKSYNFREKENSQVVKERENLH